MASHLPDLSLIAAPMVNQSDLPFRILTRAHGATLAYTQMLLPDRLLADQPYLEAHQRGLGAPHDRPVVVQLAGHDPDTLVRAARTLLGYCDAVDLNLGCPQEAAREGHYGAYLLPQRDWPLVEHIVSALAHALPVPVSAKLRLCHPAPHTLALAHRLEAAGAAWLTLHARHPSARRRRHGAADLDQVRALKFGPEGAAEGARGERARCGVAAEERGEDGEGGGSGGGVRIPVVSNGNVRAWADVVANKAQTGADGIMVGEALLANPCLFANRTPDPVRIALEYLALCTAHPGTAPLPAARAHVRHFLAAACERRPWFAQFRAALGRCASLEDIERLLRGRVRRWRGDAAPDDSDSDYENADSDSGADERGEEVDAERGEEYLQ